MATVVGKNAKVTWDGAPVAIDWLDHCDSCGDKAAELLVCPDCNSLLCLDCAAESRCLCEDE